MAPYYNPKSITIPSYDVLKIPASFHFSTESFGAAGACSYRKSKSSKVVFYFIVLCFLDFTGLIFAG
jgi:hypothetical protein